MFIQTESTPNPNSLKFLLEDDILDEGGIEFNEVSDCKNSELAKLLLEIDGIEKVFFGKNFISVNKSEYVWDQLKAPILKVISEHLGTGQKAVFSEELKKDFDSIIYDECDQQVVQIINDVLSSKVRPAIAQDGGDVKFQKYKDGTVYLSLRGSCVGCPSATQTLKNGIENLLKNYISEVKKVEQIG